MRVACANLRRMTLPSSAAVHAAADRLRDVVRQTPLRRSESLSALAGGDVFLKLETEQTTGSFKLRGAYNAVAALGEQARAHGVVAASAGNHGLGLAFAARLLGVRATVFVPSSAPTVKKDKIRAQGATLIDSAAHYDAADALARAHAHETGAAYVSPCSGDTLLAGQGTIAIEVLDACPDLRTLLVAVGGGGLVGGMAAVLRDRAPHARIIGAQSDRTAAMARSLAAGRVIEIPDEPTLAEGLAGQVDDIALAIGRAALDELVVVSEPSIASAIAWLWDVEQVRAEGAGAAAVAAAREIIAERVVVAGALATPAVIIVSGGNIDAARHAQIVADARAARARASRP